ncbi:nonsense-mediated mRNA decay factor SMG7-like [Salvia miltiorrhiza]|uniref:nonsense-mediated mRNA decay factor SMG7-like n=1 Tax=Salvia miltiorrhiza TaxID=226208 RepID=UPI0025AB62C7|nr:nonsense-mediated mRNA decay factor SMG7-like [Salvia miltiorrhiza]
MMTIPMENEKESSSRELVENLFNKNIELEKNRRKAAQARVPSDPNTWQHMRENYEAIVLEDHAFSEQHDIEYALWQLHYRKIEELRALFNAALTSAGSAASQNGKGPGRSGSDRLAKIRSQFKTFLSEATGFYHDLMLKIRAKYGLPLEYFSDGNQISMSKDGNKSSEVKKWLISCHRCLIYLGDLARYKGLYGGEGDSKARDFTAASTHYMQASSLCPSNGNAHHQLAILAGYSNDELVSIYRYFRSLAVDNPFITARDNLIIAFEKNRLNYSLLVCDGKPVKEKKLSSRVPGKGRGKGSTRLSNKDTRVATTAVKEMVLNNADLLRAFITRFIRLNGILFTRTSLETFPEVLSTVKSDLLELLPSGPDDDSNFGSDAAECKLAIVRIIAILIFTVQNVSKESENQSYADILQRSVLLQNALTGTFEFVGCILERCKLLNDPSSSYLLPGIMVFIEWLACCPDVAIGSELEEKQINARTYFWNNCISLLNKLLSNMSIFGNEREEEMCFFNMRKYDESETNRVALSEDFELRGFIPLLPAQVILDFSKKHSFGDKERVARVQRIVAAGKALANFARIGQEEVHFDTKLNKFVTGSEPQVSDDSLPTNPLEANLNNNSMGISVGTEAAYVHLTKKEVCAEDDDEDEVIVFRPTTNEKHVDDSSLNINCSELLAPISGAACKIDAGKEHGSFSVGHDSFFLQEEINPVPSATVAYNTSPYLLPVQPIISKWPVEHVPDVNGLSNLNLMDSGSLWKSEPLDQFEVSEPAAFSVPYPRFVANGASHNYSIRAPQTAVPSKFDSIMSSEAADHDLSVKPISAVAPGLKKNPISRPVRRAGPPPGFGSVPSKVLDESSKVTMAYDNPPLPQVDEYNWLDRYSLSSVNQSVGFSTSFNQVGPTIHSNGSNEMASFPFPGKQTPCFQVPSENHKDWQHYPHMELRKPYENEQQQFQNGNQQHVGPPQQYKGQSLWENSFFV